MLDNVEQRKKTTIIPFSEVNVTGPPTPLQSVNGIYEICFREKRYDTAMTNTAQTKYNYNNT